MTEPHPVTGAGFAPLISVVVPFYNVERFLSQCIESLLAQSLPREQYEIILVDNASTDRSSRIAQNFDGVIRLHQPVSGSYAARNMGICAARGEIVATIDPDCRADADWLRRIATAMQDPSCLILLGNQQHANRSLALELLEYYEAEKVAFVTNGGKDELYFGYTSNMAVRRCVFDAIGFFPEQPRGGDTVFVQRAVDRLGCNGVRFNPDMKTTHLELDSINAYYGKRLIYGQSNARISRVMSFRPLRYGERWTVFRNLVRKRRLPLRKALILLALLAPGVLLYESGRRKTHISRWFRA